MDFQTWVIKWIAGVPNVNGSSQTDGNFKLVGVQACHAGSCTIETLNSQPFLKSGMKQQPLNGYSDALGSITVPIPAGNSMSQAGTSNNFHKGTDPVFYFTQSVLIPSSANNLNLSCVSNCPTAASFAANSLNSTGTQTQFGSGANRETYTFGAQGLLDSSNSSVVASASLNNSYPQGVSQFGRFFNSSDLLSGASCPAGSGYCEPSPSGSNFSYYTYQTGKNQWNQTMWLKKSDGTVVSFDPPVSATYNVPQNASVGGIFDGKNVQIQFNGFGNLGIPGTCVDGLTNAAADCSSGNARFVPAFALTDGTTLSMGGKSVLVKALNSEIRLASTSCGTLSTSSVTNTTPIDNSGDPTLSTDSTYIGAAPSVTTAPAVIDGVLQ
jgi:hypothetical protein